MSKNIFAVIGVMVGVGLISALLTYARTEKMAPPTAIESKGLNVIQKGNVIFYGMFMPVLVGLIAFFVYRSMLTRFPETAQTAYLFLSTGIAVVFTILAAVVFRMRGFVELTTLHLFYVGGFGWLMPRLLTM